MSITITSGSLTTTPGTPQTIATLTAEGSYVLKLGLTAMASGDSVTIRALERITNGGPQEVSYSDTLTGAQALPGSNAIPVVVAAGGELVFEVSQTTGSARVIRYAVVRL